MMIHIDAEVAEVDAEVADLAQDVAEVAEVAEVAAEEDVKNLTSDFSTRLEGDIVNLWKLKLFTSTRSTLLRSASEIV